MELYLWLKQFYKIPFLFIFSIIIGVVQRVVAEGPEGGDETAFSDLD